MIISESHRELLRSIREYEELMRRIELPERNRKERRIKKVIMRKRRVKE